ncbi:MAG: Beta-glucosidase, partial [Acidimicrobiales bacterium]|nr:Beta-glucosidase [Acidimicrobiales bacterium]
RARLGVTSGDEPAESSAEDPAHRALAREAARRGIVLLANPSAVLPLDPDALRRVAVIGPNADTPALQGGGSARVNPHHTTTPLEGLVERLGAGVEVVHEPGCTAHDGTTVIDPRWLDPGPDAPDGRGQGLLVELALSDEPGAVVVHREVAARASTLWFHPPAPGLPISGWTLRGSATFRPPVGGTWRFGLTSVGPAKLLLDGRALVDTAGARPGGSFYGLGGHEVVAEVELPAGGAHRFEVIYTSSGEIPVAGIAVTAQAPVPEDALERAVEAARNADVAIVVVGSTTEWETEGADRTTLDLPGRQAELVRAVIAVNPATVVVLNAGAPVSTDWAAGADALLVCWLPGQEAGGALADVLFGDAPPTGRLPVTFPVRIEDTAAHENFPGADGQVHYREGSLIGYRHHDTNDVPPAFAFGHGLATTDFAYGEPTVATGADGRPVLRVPVTNTGTRAGTEVVQVYAQTGDRPAPAATKELVGFTVADLPLGAEVEVEVAIDGRAWTHWSSEAHGWVVEDGPVVLQVGRSAADLRGTATLDPAACPERIAPTPRAPGTGAGSPEAPS